MKWASKFKKKKEEKEEERKEKKSNQLVNVCARNKHAPCSVSDH